MQTGSFNKPIAMFAAAAMVCTIAVAGWRWWASRPADYVQVIRHAERMTAHRFLPREPDYEHLSIASYEPAIPPVSLPVSLRERAVGLLTADPPPPEAGNPACEPKPGVGLTISSGDDELEVVICLFCGWLYFSMNKERVHDHFATNEVVTKMRDLFADIYPNDEAIQKLASGDGPFDPYL